MWEGWNGWNVYGVRVVAIRIGGNFTPYLTSSISPPHPPTTRLYTPPQTSTHLILHKPALMCLHSFPKGIRTSIYHQIYSRNITSPLREREENIL
jgi:hypothetical protein